MKEIRLVRREDNCFGFYLKCSIIKIFLFFKALLGARNEAEAGVRIGGAA